MASESSSSDVKVYTSFDEMPFQQQLLRGVYAYGFETPSPIQQRAIVPMMNGSDLIGQAQAGTGKTATFAIGVLARLDLSASASSASTLLQAIILSPTRELAVSTNHILSQLGMYLAQDTNPKFCHPLVGGSKIQDDIQKLESGTLAAVVGTPGRTLDLIKCGALKTSSLKVIVVDEVDEIMSVGFVDQLDDIMNSLPSHGGVQKCFFSATMPTDVVEFSKKHLNNPITVVIRNEYLTLEGAKQFYVACEEKYKLETLQDLLEPMTIAQTVIFTNTRRKADFLAEKLQKEDFLVSLVHSEMTTQQRDQQVRAFREGRARLLVMTDIVARNFDISGINMTVNYDLPTNVEQYLQRIGRSGKFGRRQMVVNFVDDSQMPTLKEIEKFYNTKIEELPLNFAELI
jgi:translation initiation factor 4A